ncbi:MAG: MFS transporter [Lentihominibacter sp.]
MESRESYIKFAALYNFTYMSIGALLPMIGQYLKTIGFAGAEIGTVTASGTAVAIFASAFWGKVYSRSRKKHRILTLLCVMAASVCLLLSGIKLYAVFLPVFALMYFFQAPIMSLSDAFTVERMQRFGTLRAWGAAGFAAGTFLAGVISGITRLSVIFVFYIVSYMAAAVIIMSLKTDVRTEEIKENEENSVSSGYIGILKDRKIRQLILCAFFMGGTNVANNTYFSFLYIEGGGTIAGVGAVMLLMVGSEVPFMAWCERLAARFTMQKIILAAMVISSVRFLLYGIGLPWWMLIVLAFSQGAVNGILLVEFVRYVSHIAPEGSKSIAISAYYVIGSNLSTIVCQLVGGIILDHAGAAAVYAFFGLYNLTGVILYIKFRLYRSEINSNKLQKTH